MAYIPPNPPKTPQEMSNRLDYLRVLPKEGEEEDWAEEELRDFMEECKEKSTNLKKCDYCEFRFKCYTIRTEPEVNTWDDIDLRKTKGGTIWRDVTTLPKKKPRSPASKKQQKY
jgi:hypothetical protein